MPSSCCLQCWLLSLLCFATGQGEDSVLCSVSGAGSTFAEPALFCDLLTGTGYMKSTNKAIAALKATFQTPVYPLLDQVRSALGAKIDEELAHLKVR